MTLFHCILSIRNKTTYKHELHVAQMPYSLSIIIIVSSNFMSGTTLGANFFSFCTLNFSNNDLSLRIARCGPLKGITILAKIFASSQGRPLNRFPEQHSHFMLNAVKCGIHF